jgi:hypothetical protein
MIPTKMTKLELNARIRALKALKWQALKSNENKKAVMLRHQISQLKKKSRRFAGACTAESVERKQSHSHIGFTDFL